MRRKHDDDTGLSEMKAFGEELIATGARYIEAGKRWFDARREDAAAQRDAHGHRAERPRPTREHDGYRRGPDDDGHGRSAWLGGRPSRPDLHEHDAYRGPGQGHAFWDESPRRSAADPDAGAWRHEQRWQPSGGHAQEGYGPSGPLHDRDDHLTDWGHRARPGQDHAGAYAGHDHDAMRRRHTPGGWRGVGPKGYVRSDARITEDVCEQLLYDDAIDARHITVQVRDGVVTLEGQVQTRSIKHRVENVAERCAGVRDIENRLRVQTGDAWRSEGRPGAQPEASSRPGEATGSRGDTAGTSGAAGSAGSVSSSGIADTGPGGAAPVSSQDDPTVKGA